MQHLISIVNAYSMDQCRNKTENKLTVKYVINLFTWYFKKYKFNIKFINDLIIKN